jgi:hypothetical protein
MHATPASPPELASLYSSPALIGRCMVGEACTDVHPLPRAPMPRSARCRYGRNRRHRSDPFLPLSPQQQPQCRNGTRSPIWLNGEHTWLGRINMARRWLTLSHAQLSLLSYVAGRNSCAGNVLRLATSARPVTRSARAVPHCNERARSLGPPAQSRADRAESHTALFDQSSFCASMWLRTGASSAVLCTSDCS